MLWGKGEHGKAHARATQGREHRLVAPDAYLRLNGNYVELASD
jgi:hypothetical protein